MTRAPSPNGRDHGGLEIRIAPGLPQVELHAASAFAHSHPPHWHDEYFLTAITEGEGVFGFRGTEHRARAGSLVLVVPGEVHTHASGRHGRSFRSLHAGSALIAGLTEEFPMGLRFSVFEDTTLQRRFLALHRRLESPGSTLRKESSLLAFFLQLAGSMPETSSRPLPRSEHRAVRRVRELLDDSCSPRVTLRELASLAGLSPFHLHRLFRDQVGMPPHEYHLRRRLMRARELLGSGSGEPVSIADVAASTGFADQSHLTRQFKRVLGLAPAAYSRGARRKNVQDAWAGGI